MIHGPQDFFNAAYNIGYTFNWFYADPNHIAYFNSGLNPVRAPHTDPLFPSWASDPWQGFRPAAQMTPASLTEKQTAQNAHPHVIDQSYLTSWNNKQAPGYNDAATAPAVLLDLPLAAAGLEPQPLPRDSATASCRWPTSSTRWAMPEPRTCAASRCCHTR